MRREVAVLQRGVLAIPDHTAGPAVERDEMAIAGDEEDSVREQCYAAVDRVSFGGRIVIDPDTAARSSIQRVYLVRVREVHDPVQD